MRIMVLIVVLGAAASCASISGQHRDILREQLKAENRLIKKNSELALRENEVLKRENAQHRSEIEKLTETAQQLTDDLDSLNRKYQEDMARLDDAYKNLYDQFITLKLESDEKIQELTSSNELLEKRFAKEVSKLNGLLEEQKVAFHTERDLLKAGFESKIKKLEARLALSRQESDEKEKTIESLEKDRQEVQARIIELDKTVTVQNEKIKQSEHQYQEMMSSSQQLLKDIDEKQAIIDALTATLHKLQEAADQTTGQ